MSSHLSERNPFLFVYISLLLKVSRVEGVTVGKPVPKYDGFRADATRLHQKGLEGGAEDDITDDAITSKIE